jgi:hypothetical protein
MGWIGLLIPLLIIGGIAYTFARRNREHETNAPLRGEIEAQVRFATTLDLVKILGTGGFGGTRGQWIAVMKSLPKRLVVGTDAFMVVGPLSEYVFRGCESSIALSQAPSRVVSRDWIVITGQNGTRQVQLAVTKRGSLPEIWQALAGTGAKLVLRVIVPVRTASVVACLACGQPSADACWRPSRYEIASEKGFLFVAGEDTNLSMREIFLKFRSTVSGDMEWADSRKHIFRRRASYVRVATLLLTAAATVVLGISTIPSRAAIALPMVAQGDQAAPNIVVS